MHDGPLPNSEPKLRALFDRLAAHGRLLVVVDQPATIGALPVAVAWAGGHQVAYLPGLAMRRDRRPLPGTRETDARDAYKVLDPVPQQTRRAAINARSALIVALGGTA